MDSHTPPPPPTATRVWPAPVQWGVLLVASVASALVFTQIGMPAAFLLAPMLCGIAAGVAGATVRPHEIAFSASQAILGILVARSLSTELIGSFVEHWMLFFFVVLATLFASSIAGYFISRWKIMPGTVGVWGSAPGAATAMVLMAEAFGADARLVAFMQYLRVVIVTLIAAFVSRLFVDTSGVTLAPVPWFPEIVPVEFGASIAVALVGGVAGRLLRVPAPYFLGSMVLGIALEFSGLAVFQLPQWLLAASYIIVGWAIGLRFTREILHYVLRVLPQIVGSILLLVLFCGGLATGLVYFTDIDPLTAYLATSPGGMDSVAIIAAASQHVNITFVMSIQVLRFLIVLLFGPALARLVARLVNRTAPG